MSNDVAEGWAKLEGSLKPTPPQRKAYDHYRPFRAAIGDFVSEAQNDERIFIGIEQFDREMRGVSSGHFCSIVGRTHSGKTLLATHIMRMNAERRMILYSPDETRTLILAKLAAATHGINSIELEARVASDDQDAIRLLHETVDAFPNLAVFDKRLSHLDMQIALDETMTEWGDKPEAVFVDFMKLVEGETMQAKFEFIKGFGMHNRFPLFALHQMSRTAGAKGQEVTLEGGEFGGEDYATFQIGVRRRKYELEFNIREARAKAHADEERIRVLEEELRWHQNTITVNLTKNKRPGGDAILDTDFGLDRTNGRIYELGHRAPTGYVPPKYEQTEF